MTVSFGGVEFLLTGLRGFVVQPGGLRGLGPVGARRDNVARPNADGAFWSRGHRLDRLIEVEGHALAKSPRELARMRDQLAAIRVDYGKVVIAREDMRWTWGTLQSTAWDELDETTASFLVQIWCPDPWLFGDVRAYKLVSGGHAEVVHRGTEIAAPSVEVVGPVDAGWGVQVGARRVDVARAVTAGETVTVDCRTGSVRSSLAGEVMSPVSGDFPRIGPAMTSVARFHGTGSGTATIRVTDTYV